MSLLALLWVPLAAVVVDIPLLGSPLTPPILDELRDLKGVAAIQADDRALRLEVEPRGVVRLSAISETIRRHTVKTEIDYDGIPLGAHITADAIDGDGDRVRDLLIAFSGCPSSRELTIDAAQVNTAAGTRFDCEPGCDGLFEHLTSDQFCPFLVAGLPMRARGTNDAGILNASRVRIDGQIKVTGSISVDSAGLTPGTAFTLSVIGFGDLQFVVVPGALIDSFAAGSTVRVEGVAPPLTAGGGLPMFGATEIQN